MVKSKFRKLTQLSLVLSLLSWATVASAGPGGGTYFANSPAGGASGTALRKFVDSLPGLGAANANNLGQYIPVAVPDTTTFPGSDYYVLGLKDYTQKMHSDLPKATKLRGYYQINSTDPTVQNVTQYLGPLILASQNRPVRIRFENHLGTGSAGNLFIPVDTTLMGAGMGPVDANGNQCTVLVPSPNIANQLITENCSTNVMYTQNRATLHLHGGNTPWISDGTPHQWTAPVGETSVPLQMRKGASARDVPDMPPSGDGALTFYWTNEQSNRLMFYHDHALGITRLNVYAGEAAGYLLTDPVEEGLINTGVLPNVGGVYRYGIPLVIQDKTFVPQDVAVQDAKWDTAKWGQYGDLWFPHVYEPNQDPTSPDGANPFGRWDYGPWFWPPQVITDPAKRQLPEPSTTPEAFMDTPVVNGTAYPYLTVEPKAYRFRILNASNDRTLNLQIYYADPNDPSGTEVKMVPAGPNPAFPADWPTDGRAGGVPDPATVGPNMIQIGSEGGFLPAPVVIPNHPINYEYNRRNIVVLNVNQTALMLGPAERADVIVDFSQVPPGSRLILYNDGPAPNPGFDTRYDYYTGDPDQTSTGGAPSTLRGYGPNTRTIMQFRVAGTPAAPFNLAALQTGLPAAFQTAQPPLLVPEPTYPVASGGYGPTELYAKIQDYSLTLPMNTLANPAPAAPLPTTIPFRPKTIQELWDPYGRMNATLGVELPFTSQLNQTTIPMGYAEPITENIVDGQPQIWKITHNGVDTHPVHFHMVNVQVINRVGWDGAIRPPDPNELGWKEVVRMNPLEDIIVGIVPKAQSVPFALPNSARPIDPTMPPDALLATTDFGNLGTVYSPSPAGQGTPSAGVAVTVRNTPAAPDPTDPNNIVNVGYDYGQEFVWHCHILGHEENDFMRPLVFTTSALPPPAPAFGTPVAGGAFVGGTTVPGATNYVASYVNPSVNQVVLQWNDGAPVSMPSSFMIQRNGQPIATVSYEPGFPPIYTDSQVAPNTAYTYQVVAFNVAGQTAASDGPINVTTGSWTDPTGVTLIPSKPTPHVVGTNVQFTAAGSGATTTVPNTSVSYLYRFSLQSGTGPFVVVQDYGPDATWTLPATTPVGSYAVRVETKTSAGANAVVLSATMPYQVVPTPIPPVTVASPIPGVYSAAPVVVTLTASTNAPPATIYYTTDGSMPTTASAVYTAPITLNATTTINYFAVDVNGTQEAIHSDTWTIHSSDLVATVFINNGAAVTNSANVTLALNAFDPVGIATMQFSNDGVIYSAEEPYATTKAWTLAPGDGFKTVYVRFRDKSLPSGNLYDPVTASITLSTTAPVTSASPVSGTYAGPVSVHLVSTAPGTIYYTTDGSTPTTSSAKYTGPIPVNATTTINYFAIDTVGNTEQVKSGTWTINVTDPAASVKINNGARTTRTPSVTLTLAATGPVSMLLSNDGIAYNTEEPFVATKAWTLTPGEGLKTVYVRFRDAANNLQPPVAATITMGIKDGLIPGTASYLESALMALKFANGMAIPSDLDLAHADVAPYRNGASQPDDKIDVGDAYLLLLRAVNTITSF